nr:hybrid sensor histidine kinase/response regulator transcription factor [uncultured Pedobacter sp.]
MSRNKLLYRLINSVLLLMLLFCSVDASAQKNNISFNHLTVEDGLSQSSVLSIAQDSMGFMWFGTKDGLNKFNTQRFEVFKHDKNNNTSLSSSQNINYLLTDRKGNLWVATQKGLNLYLPKSNSFKRFLHDPKDKNSISDNIIRNLFEDKKGNIWVGTDNGLNKLIGPDKFQRFYNSNVKGQGLAHSLIKAIYQDHNNVLWIATLKGLTSMKEEKGKYVFQSYFHDPSNSASLINNDLSAIFEDQYHNLWIGTHNNGLELMDRATGTFKHYSAKSEQSNGLSSNVIRKIKADKDGKLWISTLNGIDIFDVKTGKFTVLNHIPNDPLTLNQNSTYDILKDAAGSMWVGTYYGGVNVYHANSTPFREYKTSLGGNGISSNVISAIVEDESHNLWIGTEAEGLNYYNRTTGKFKAVKNQIGNPNSLSSNLVKAISIDKKGRVWVATYEGNLDVYLPSSGTFKHYKPNSADPHALNSNRIVCLLHDSQGRLWVGTRAQGVFLYNETKDNFSVLSSPVYNQELKFVRTFFEDAAKNIWIATNSGIYIASANSNQIKEFKSKSSDFKFDDINFIKEDSKGNIWIGSYESGLIKYDKNRDTSRFTVNDGLPSNNTVGFLEDSKGNLWISTSNGLSKFDGKVFKNYTVDDGLPGNVFNYNSSFKDSKNEMFFGGYNGMVSFFPDEIRDNKKIPKAIFTRLRLFNKPVNINDKTGLLTQNIGLTKELTFSYNQNIFTIDFAILNYIKSEKNRYAYQLKGFEKGWNYVATPQATFTNLPAGRYVLLIKGANNDGVWTNKPEEMIINVNPPYWKTWWAYLIYILFLSGLIFLVLRFLWIRTLLRKEHEIYQMKLDFFTNVSHEIRTPLTLIVGPLEHLVNETKESPALNRRLLTVKKNAGRLTRLVNELMDFRKAESGNMELNVAPGNIVSFAKEIYISFTYVALKNHIDYRFNCDEDIIEVYFDSEQLEKVLFNLLSNAFKFTPDHGVIRLDIVKTNDNYVEIRVADNGKGIPEESRNKIFTNFYQVRDHRSGNTGTGIGLALAEKISRLHHGRLSLVNNDELKDEDVHTCFSLRLKLGKEHFKKDELIEQYISIENPILYQQVSEIEPVKNYEPAEKTEDGITVLIVEDNVEVRSFIAQSLKQSYQVIEANNGEEGVKIAIEKIPDIIVSDVMMPVMDGLELCRTLKTDPRTSHIPIILLTARSGNIHEINGLKTGAEAYITKPFSINSLQLNIYNLLTLQANMRRKFSQQITLQPTNILIESADEEFLNKIMGLIEANFNNEDFSVNTLAAEVGMSTPILYKKIKALTDLTVNNFIKSVRLKRAAQLLKHDVYTVYEVAYMVGFSDSKYFSKEFAKQFGQTPSEYSLK